MKLIWQYMKQYTPRILGSTLLKLAGTLGELSLPYILEYIIDHSVPAEKQRDVFLLGSGMILISFFTREFNVWANRTALSVGRDSITDLRHDLFCRTISLSGSRFDHFSLPSLQSRMTSDSYNVQEFMTKIQTIGIRAPIMLIGGIILTLTMDVPLSLILCAMIPLMGAVTLTISARGIPLYLKVQSYVDRVVCVLRENISGIRVIKALSREEHETERFRKVNEDLTSEDTRAGSIMALPGPFMELCLNIGLTLVVIVGAQRVNVGLTRPGVILAFLTYFNLILNAIRGLNRIFVIYSKARASADRIGLVLAEREDQPVIGKNTAADEYCPVKSDNYIEFRHVSFRYDGDAAFAVKQAAGAGDSADSFAGGKRENCLSDISFSIGKGDSLGIIGPTGCGKTTILNLLMRFYDAGSGTVLIGGRDVRSYERDELRRKFGAVFQNDVVFADTVRRNIDFGRHLTDEQIDSAANDACVTAYIYDFAERYEHRIEIHGANLSGGQKQRIMIARALAAHPDILILDDSSSALDFRTDARLRSAIRKKYRGTTTIMVAQRVSSIMQMDKILVISDGQIEACGKHRDLLRNCPYYREVYESQMGAENAAAE